MGQRKEPLRLYKEGNDGPLRLEQMLLYTVQALEVVERLTSGISHVQPWEKSAACTGTPNDPDGRLYRVAYKFLAQEFTTRMNAELSGAPVFTSINRETARATLHVSGPSRLLTLDVPTSEVLLTNHHFWAWTILSNWCGLHGCFTDDENGCNAPCREETWRAAVFEVPQDPAKQQGVLNRIEPSWLRSIYSESPPKPKY